jgi:hypothetical protein
MCCCVVHTYPGLERILCGHLAAVQEQRDRHVRHVLSLLNVTGPVKNIQTCIMFLLSAQALVTNTDHHRDGDVVVGRCMTVQACR